MTAERLRELSGRLSGRYILERELGAGGMATVYLARDVRHDREVALKVLRPDLAESLGRDRFLREIRLAARLNHPNILPLYESGEADGDLFFVMPVMQGQTLRDRLVNEGPMPVEVAVRLAQEVADALDYAHRNDVVHRDIKPENILLHEGHAIVADFGIGKAIAAAVPSESSSLTQFGMMVGTPAYMSPEQAAGDEVDGRSDLFALGCVMYEMLTGDPPFTGFSVQAVIAKRFHHTPPNVGELRPAIPASVSFTVDRLLEKSREDRPATGAMVVEALRSQETIAFPKREPKSVAVLPFVNMSADADNEFFSDGITDDIIGGLTKVHGLKVAARASSFSFKGRNEELATIGQKLGVRTVLQGSVRRAGSRVRVTAQLMNTGDGYQLWSDRFDRELHDIFAIQDEIAHSIVQHLELTLGLKEETPLVVRQTDDLEAYQLYLRGREAVLQRTAVSIQRGVEFLTQALARDPLYLRAHVGLAEAYIGLGVYGYMHAGEARRIAEEALANVARLDSGEQWLHTLRAQLKLYLRPDWATADEDLARALSRAPDDSLANLWAATLGGLRGDREARNAYVRRAISADPLSHFVHALAGHAYFYTGEYHEALALHDKALTLDPNFISALWGSAMSLRHLGRHDEAIRRTTLAVEISQRSGATLGIHALCLGMGGRRDEAQALIPEIEARTTSSRGVPVTVLVAYVGLGDEEQTAVALQRNIAAESGPLSLATTIKPELDAFLGHPRLGGLVKQLALYSKHMPALIPVVRP